MMFDFDDDVNSAPAKAKDIRIAILWIAGLLVAAYLLGLFFDLHLPSISA